MATQSRGGPYYNIIRTPNHGYLYQLERFYHKHRTLKFYQRANNKKKLPSIYPPHPNIPHNSVEGGGVIYRKGGYVFPNFSPFYL